MLVSLLLFVLKRVYTVLLKKQKCLDKGFIVLMKNIRFIFRLIVDGFYFNIIQPSRCLDWC